MGITDMQSCTTRARAHTHTHLHLHSHTDTCDLQGAVAKFDQPRLVCINRNIIAAICLPAIQLSPIALGLLTNRVESNFEEIEFHRIELEQSRIRFDN